tara:strand:+ start:1715 stop:2128 length:414 start_codon:yes stop_codon:yes gene_type:complete
MKITKWQLKRIIREEYTRILKESAFQSQELADLAEEHGIYHKDWYDVPGFCEAALDAGLMTLEDVDAAAVELSAAGINSVEDAIVNTSSAPSFIRGSAVGIVNNAVREYRSGNWPMHRNPKFASSSYAPMLAWIVSH